MRTGLSRTIIAAAVLLAGVLSAQSPQATISGIVTDPQGAVIPDVEITAINVATGIRTATRSNEVGFYSLRALPVGDYVIAAERAGFRRSVREGVTITTGQSLALDITLEVGAVTESVTVSAAAPLLETRTSGVSQLVEARTIEDMPLGDRRAMNLIQIMPAAVFVAYDSGSKPNFSLAGGRTQSQMFYIDGGSGQNMRLGIGQFDMDPPVEVLHEVKVLANNYSAEYGGSAGGVIVAATKSGTNRFRGSLFEYLRNDRLDAANFFAPVSAGRKVKAPLRYNVFGGTLGGPIRRDRTFFFFSYEGVRRREGDVRTLTVPTELQKAGDFSQTFDIRGGLIPIYDPATTRTEAGRQIRQTFPGNQIPRARFDGVAASVLPFYPTPNRLPDNVTGANNFRANYVRQLSRNNFAVKLEHSLGQKDRLTARYLFNSEYSFHTSVYPQPAADTLNDADARQQYWYAAWNRTFTPTLLNDFRFNYGNRMWHSKSKGLGGGWPAKIGLRGVPETAFPTFNVSGFAALGSGMHERRQFPIQQYHFVENLSWIRGRHSLKFGTELRRSSNRDVLSSSASGNFTFDTRPTGQPGAGGTGNGLATLLLGFPTSFFVRQTQVLDRSSWYLSWFVQDDWTVHRDLTLNFGLRWETDTPMVDANNRINSFDASAINPISGTPGVVRFAGVGGFPKQPYSTDWNNFGPRFGFAWKPLGIARTVLRGGYGIFYAHPFDRGVPMATSLGFELSMSMATPDAGLTAPFYLRDGVPGLDPKPPVLSDAFGAVAVGQLPTTAVTFFEHGRRTGYSQQFNLGLQFELPHQTVFEIGYLSNLSHKLPSATLSINQIRPEQLGPGAGQRDRPFPQFSGVSIVAPTLGDSAYHAGTLRLEKRFTHGLNFLATYTWAKFLNNVDEAGSALGAEGSPYSNFYNRRADWGPSENDIRHRFTWASVWEAPVGEGRKLLSQHPVRHILGGWGIGSVVSIQSGAPFTVTTLVDTTNAFAAGPLRADVIRNPNVPAGDRLLSRWFDTDAFRQPAIYQFGNQGVNILRADGIVKFDFSVLRNFSLGEDKRIQFRGEFFNMFNHPDFGIPGRIFGAAGFGVVSSARAARQIQFGLRLTF